MVARQQVGVSIRDAYFADTENISSSQAVGRISADLIAPNLPGVGVTAPGELLTEQFILVYLLFREVTSDFMITSCNK